MGTCCNVPQHVTIVIGRIGRIGRIARTDEQLGPVIQKQQGCPSSIHNKRVVTTGQPRRRRGGPFKYNHDGALVLQTGMVSIVVMFALGYLGKDIRNGHTIAVITN
jgi:hypothetical protein